MHIEKGDTVLIKSLKLTKRRHGVSSEMEIMLDGEYEVQSTAVEYNEAIAVYVRDDDGQTWTFAPEDLEVINPLDHSSIAMTSELIMFDPKDLMAA